MISQGIGLRDTTRAIRSLNRGNQLSTQPQADSLGKFLQTIRRQRGLTQQQLADLSTLSVRAVRDLESDRVRAPRRETIRLLAGELGMSGHARERLEALAFGQPQAGQVLPPPLPLSTLLCRDGELRALNEILAEQDTRLIWMTGLSGVGKSRIVVEAARIWQKSGGDAYWLSSGHGRSPSLRSSTERVLRSTTDRGRIEGMAPLIRDQRALLVLDGIVGTDEEYAEVTALL
jgi:transcriptional regulator with XRE-family HTH domain